MKKVVTFISIVAIFLALAVNVRAYAEYGDEVEEQYYAVSRVVLAFRDESGNFLSNLPAGEIFTVLKTDPRDTSRAWILWNGREGSVIKSGIEKTDQLPKDVLSKQILDCSYTRCALNLRVPENYGYIITIPTGELVSIVGTDEYNPGRVVIKWGEYEGSVLESGLVKISNSDCIIIDIDSQYVRMYKGGNLICEGSVVTGNKGSHDTPKGIYSIYSMSTGETLRGADYACYVSYWMPFYYGYGLHDASWRSNFGGNIYEYAGSHGCINMPYELAETIYENAYVGIAVVVI